MDRFAIFVDAGYLWAEGGKLCHSSADRLRLALDFRKTVADLADMAKEHSNMQYLRTYWYDAATDASPSPRHVAVASIPGVKLRLGKLSMGRQKGVDSRIVRDLIVLSRDKAITAAYVLSGDEDIREGVAEAQDQGVSVVLFGITPLSGQHNQARTLVQEADDHLMLTQERLSQWLTFLPAPSFSAGSASPTPVALAGMEELGRGFGEEWVKVNPDSVAQAANDRPRIRQAVDRELLVHGSAATGGADLTEPQRRSLRNGFWAALDEAIRRAG